MKQTTLLTNLRQKGFTADTIGEMYYSWEHFKDFNHCGDLYFPQKNQHSPINSLVHSPDKVNQATDLRLTEDNTSENFKISLATLNEANSVLGKHGQDPLDDIKSNSKKIKGIEDKNLPQFGLKRKIVLNQLIKSTTNTATQETSNNLNHFGFFHSKNNTGEGSQNKFDNKFKNNYLR